MSRGTLTAVHLESYASLGLMGIVAVAASGTSQRARTDEIVFLRNDRVFLMSSSGGAQRRANFPVSPTWSPDGRRSAFAVQRGRAPGLYVAGRYGEARRRIVRVGRYDNCLAPSWSPDGTRLAYTLDCEVDFMSISVVNRDGTKRRPLVPGTWHLGPEWSPDGRRILFVSNPAPHKKGWFLYLVDPDGQRLRRIPQSTLNPDYSSDWFWSRDGRSIFFLTGEKLYVIRRDGSGRRELAPELTKISRASLSPDGRTLVLQAVQRGPGWEIFVVDSDGTDLRPLTNNRVWDTEPSWSPDGRRIAFTSARDGNTEIYVMNADGTLQTNISRHPTPDELPRWVPRRRR